MSMLFAKEPQKVRRIKTKYRQIVTDLPAPESIDILEKLIRFEPHSMQGQPPVVWDRAEGFQVCDPYGNMWLDWSSGVLVTNVGHGHPKIRDAIISEVEQGLLFSYCFPTEVRAKLAERLVKLAPEKINKIFFLSTGSEATENAIKLARTYGHSKLGTDKNIIVSFERSFHGRTMGSQMAGGFPSAKSWILNLDKDFIQVPFPDGYRCSDISFESFENALDNLGAEPKYIAGIMMESYQGGGASFAPVEYVQKLRDWCTKHDVLLIFDEVQSGFGRTGKLFAYEHYDVKPDLICLGKAITGSLPLSAVMGNDSILDLYGPGSMTSTHGGNPLSCAAALASLDVLENQNLIENACYVGSVLKDGLQNIMDSFPDRIGALHGKGLVYGLHIVQKDSNEPDADTAFKIINSCYEAGLLMFAPVGYGGATIKICPPLTITKEAIDEGLLVLRKSFEEISDK